MKSYFTIKKFTAAQERHKIAWNVNVSITAAQHNINS
jgi:hypothetical protein